MKNHLNTGQLNSIMFFLCTVPVLEWSVYFKGHIQTILNLSFQKFDFQMVGIQIPTV